MFGQTRTGLTHLFVFRAVGSLMVGGECWRRGLRGLEDTALASEGGNMGRVDDNLNK